MKRIKNKSVNVRKQLKIKLQNTLVRYKNKVGFKPTEHQAYHWFRIINRGLFNNRLPMVPIRIKKLHHDWGRCVADWDNRKCRKGTYNQKIIPYNKTNVVHYIELHCKFPTWKEFIETLSAPQLSSLLISSTLLTPPPTVKGTKHFFEVFSTTS